MFASLHQEVTMRFLFLVGLMALAVGEWSCGGSSNSSSTPTPTGTTTISIQFSNGLGNLGANSFSPNPASVSQGAMVAWHNSDSTTHHIVLNDGSLDTGDIAPGASSPAKALSVSGGQYHCTIHPTMVGSLNVATNPPPSGPGY
jgi:plastocyanin